MAIKQLPQKCWSPVNCESLNASVKKIKKYKHKMGVF